MHLRLLIILAASVRFCAGHGNLLKAVFPQDQVVCAGTAPGSLCTPTDGVRARTLIARAGVCDGASDSECDRQPYACDHCGLERKETNDRLPGPRSTDRVPDSAATRNGQREPRATTLRARCRRPKLKLVDG